MRWVLLFAALLAVPQTLGVERLETGHEPLVSDWNASQGRARLVAILSPT